MDKVTYRGAFAIAQAEGLVPVWYIDSVGVDTYGVGHTAAAGEPHPRSKMGPMPKGEALDVAIREAWKLYERDLIAYTQPITDLLGPLKPHELDGWVMWNYNTGGIRKTSAVAMWRAGDKAGAVRKLQQWNKVTQRGRKVVSKALTKRRALEANIILKGEYPTGTMAIWPTDGNGRVVWRAVRRLTYMETIELAHGIGNGGAVASYVKDPAPQAPTKSLWQLIRRKFS